MDYFIAICLDRDPGIVASEQGCYVTQIEDEIEQAHAEVRKERFAKRA